MGTIPDNEEAAAAASIAAMTNNKQEKPAEETITEKAYRQAQTTTVMGTNYLTPDVQAAAQKDVRVESAIAHGVEDATRALKPAK